MSSKCILGICVFFGFSGFFPKQVVRYLLLDMNKCMNECVNVCVVTYDEVMSQPGCIP